MAEARLAALKDAAKALLGANDLEGAEALYSQALEIAPSSALLLSNRALVRARRGHHEASLADAQEAVRLDPAWLKGHYHRVRALMALERPLEAKAAFSVGCENGGRTNADFVALEEAVERAYIPLHYDPLTRDMDVRVRWTGPDRGKGVFATKPIRMFKPIFSERPLVSHRKLACTKDPRATPVTHPSCAHCMRSFVAKSDVDKTRFAPVWPRVYGKGSATPAWQWCHECGKRQHEVVSGDLTNVKVQDAAAVADPFVAGNPFFLERYCTEECRDAAFKLWHRSLCGATFVSDAQRVHPLHHLYNLCVTTGRTNPLMIARIYAMVFQRIMEHGQTPEQAFQDFRNFASGPEPTPIDEMAVFLLKNLYVGLPEMEALITLEAYQRLNGAIMRNAQTIQPVSDLHMWFERALGAEAATGQDALLGELGMTPEFLKHYMAKEEMTMLSKVEGAGLFPVANCMNHSCDPNVISSSSHNDHTVTFVALRPIEAGEELCISYVDDNLDWQERRKHLETYYAFTCKCMRCHVQSNPEIKIIE